MSGDPRLESILRWSLSQADGTAPARQISEEDRKWFREALESQVVDVVRRMKDITAVMSVGEEKLEQQGITVQDIGSMLEELQEHVESIDMANDLKAIGGLEPLLEFLKSPHALLRARAAEVVMTMVQNNPKSQQNVMQAGGLIILCQVFTSDADVVARAKALGAIASLVRHNAEGLSSFREICGVKQLLKALAPGDAKLTRKSMHLLKYLLEQHPADRQLCAEPEVTPELTGLLDNADADLRTSGAEVLLEVAAALKPGSEGKAAVMKAVDLRLAKVSTLSGEDAEDAQDERRVLEQLSLTLSGQGVRAEVQSGSVQQSPLLLGGPPR